MEMRVVSFDKTRSDLKYHLDSLIYLAGSQAPYIHAILSLCSVHYIIHYSAISKNAAADYQSISQDDIICTDINCAMIQYNSLSECSVSTWNTSHLIPFQHYQPCCYTPISFILIPFAPYQFHTVLHGGSCQLPDVPCHGPTGHKPLHHAVRDLLLFCCR